MAILDIVKKSLLIPLEESFADSELESYINSCKEFLISTGVSSEVVNDESNNLVFAIIIIYVKTFFGFKNDGTVKELPKSFDMLVRQLALTKGEINNVS